MLVEMNTVDRSHQRNRASLLSRLNQIVGPATKYQQPTERHSYCVNRTLSPFPAGGSREIAGSWQSGQMLAFALTPTG